MKKVKLLKLVSKLNGNINWENWKKHTEEGEQEEYFKIGDVFANKLQWILEEEEISDEAADTILDIQHLICPILNELDIILQREITK